MHDKAPIRQGKAYMALGVVLGCLVAMPCIQWLLLQADFILNASMMFGVAGRQCKLCMTEHPSGRARPTWPLEQS